MFQSAGRITRSTSGARDGKTDFPDVPFGPCTAHNRGQGRENPPGRGRWTSTGPHGREPPIMDRSGRPAKPSTGILRKVSEHPRHPELNPTVAARAAPPQRLSLAWFGAAGAIRW